MKIPPVILLITGNGTDTSPVDHALLEANLCTEVAMSILDVTCLYTNNFKVNHVLCSWKEGFMFLKGGIYYVPKERYLYVQRLPINMSVINLRGILDHIKSCRIACILFDGLKNLHSAVCLCKVKLLFIVLLPSQLRLAPWACETVWNRVQPLPNLHTH